MRFPRHAYHGVAELTMNATPSAWGPVRQRIAALAILTAALTGVGGAVLGGSAWHLYGAGVYVAIAIAALFSHTWIAVQVIAGQLIAGSLLLGQRAHSPLLVLPVVASVIATTELLALVARADARLERDPFRDVATAWIAACAGAAISGAILLVAAVPGPTGLLAIGLASGACVGLGIVLVGSSRRMA
jgi:hypothetical protein